MEKKYQIAADHIRNSENMIALTGAGISTESGIPDFRSAGGLWDKYDPSVYATIDSFVKTPEKVWEMLFDMIDLAVSASPNPGHYALARLENMGLLKFIITQNIDNLHQNAGNRKVVEYHGNATKLQCMKCGKIRELADVDLGSRKPPRCPTCDKILKPTVIFFGEMIPQDAMRRSELLAEGADLVLVVGTSAVVYPAAKIPVIAKSRGATVIEFNIEETELTRHVTDIFIQGKAGTTLPAIVELLRE